MPVWIVNISPRAVLKLSGKRWGLILDIGGYYKNVITIAPSLYITREEINLAIRLLREALHKALKTI
jgi:4-aminobutyrate aminotransferase-like enzyme